MTFLKYASFNFTRDRLSTKDQMSNDYVKCQFSRGKKKDISRQGRVQSSLEATAKKP